MKSVFVFTSVVGVCHGHGDYGETITLTTKECYGKEHYPAFLSEEKAMQYLFSLGERGSWGLKITELKLLD